jgi:hypothetical protein
VFALVCLMLVESRPCLLAVEGQPLAANVRRVQEALAFLGAPLPSELTGALESVLEAEDANKIQDILDTSVLFLVDINPEIRVKIRRGTGSTMLQQGAYTPVLVKINNLGTTTQQLRVQSKQAGQVYGDMSTLSAERMHRQHFNELEDKVGDPKRFLDLEMYQDSPMTRNLSGLEVEYAIALIFSRDDGKREATIEFDVGQGTQDIGFRAELPVLFDVRSAVSTKLNIRDFDGSPTAARLVFKDVAGKVYPPQSKRLAPDFYFQEQIYRSDGDAVLLPPGKLFVESSRGPEYIVQRREMDILDTEFAQIDFDLERWVNPADYGFYSGDHHIHGAGCAHYESPTLGVRPEDMFMQVKGEGLNVGCILTWGPCFEFQRQFFSPIVNEISESMTLLKYDLEISGFGSASLGHVCLLNLKNQTYPGSDGSKDKGWPTWTTPVMRWTKEQGGYAGYAHSGSGLRINVESASKRMMDLDDDNDDQVLSRNETSGTVLPFAFEAMDKDRDRFLSGSELSSAINKAADQLPNFAIPEMNGVGAMEICVSIAEGVCDFISAMDTSRIPEWNMWYHILNCGFPLKVSGETDFPCMSGGRVGQGRVYVQLGERVELEFSEWCKGMAEGRSYVSDGYAHALDFRADGMAPGFGDVNLDAPGSVLVEAQVVFAPETPLTVAQGNLENASGPRDLGDTVTFHGPPPEGYESGGMRTIELVVNGEPVASKVVPADGEVHDLSFDVAIEKSSWIALRHFPQLHTNPINIIVAENPIRVSRKSALWCIETINQLWRARGDKIADHEKKNARAAFDRAILMYERIAEEAK